MYKYETNSNCKKEIFVFCSECRLTTNHTVMTDLKEKYDEEHFFATNHYQVIKCNGCNFISFRKLSLNSEDYDCSMELIWRETIYPERIETKSNFDIKDLSIPDECCQIYKETKKALSSKLVLLGAMGLRSLIESICNNQIEVEKIPNSIKSKNLKEKINLLSKDRLPNSSKEVLHKVREIGNKSTHDTKRQDINLLCSALEILENLLQILYILPAKCSQFNQSSKL